MIAALTSLQRLLLTAWVGAVWAIGYLAVPVLFAALDDRMLAGALAGTMFEYVAWLGVASASAVLVLQLRTGRGGLSPVVLGCVVLMLALSLVGQFVIQPIMAELKAQAGPGGVMSGALRERFGMWHGVSSVLYLCQSALGGLVIWRAGAARPAA
ncbi:MAG: DUF4149 domain-containing protein [Rhodocyclaceae bacterium]|nr:DUF4149 domain-containing protein [Rhodocyclaceae bacterium]